MHPSREPPPTGDSLPSPPTALVRPPGPRLGEGARTFVPRLPLDPELALRQHAVYCAALRRAGARVLEAPEEPDAPDAAFVEDAVIVLDGVAILARTGAEHRRSEGLSLAPILRQRLAVVDMPGPGRLEGGDVLRIGRVLFVGRSRRTDAAGIRWLSVFAADLGFDVVPVPVSRCLHLKTGCGYLDDARVLVNPRWVDVAYLEGVQAVPVPEQEPLGANVLRLGAHGILPDAFPRTARLLEGEGVRAMPIPMSEFLKAEAGPTCLSVLLPRQGGSPEAR